MRERRRPRRDGRLTRFAPALAVAVVFAAGSAVVLADGGDSSLVHACVEGQTARPNVIIVGVNEGCPAGFSPMHWPSESAAGGTPLDEASSPPNIVIGDVPPAPGVNKLYKKQGIKLAQTVKESKVLGPFPLPSTHGGGVSCPGAYPYRVSGGYSLSKEGDSPLVFAVPQASQPVGDHGWWAKVHVFGVASSWTLTVEVVCGKFKPK